MSEVRTPGLGESAAEVAAASPVSIRAWYTLGVLVVVTLFAFLDRQVLMLLAEQIKHSLGLTDFQLGLLQGTAVALFSAVAAYPLAWAADRLDRRLILVGCVIIWSLAVVGCGLARDFTQLVLAAALVAAAEAGLAPLTFAVIPELFPPEKRQIANSVFTLASATTGSIALALGGQMIAGVAGLQPHLPVAFAGMEIWRLSFLAAAVPAPLMIVLLFTVRLGGRRERPAGALPSRAALSGVPDGEPVPPLLAFLARQRWAMARLYAAFGMANFAYQALLAWIVVIAIRAFGQTEAQVGAALGLTVLIATAIGFATSLLLTRFLAPRLGPALPIRVILVGYLLSGALLALLWFARDVRAFYAIMFAAYAVNMTMGMVTPTAIQTLAPPVLRARAMAANFVVNVLIVSGAAPLVGLISDQFGHTPRAILGSALLITVPGLIAAGLMIRLSERGFVAVLRENGYDQIAA